jgi:hypothetical protein
MTTPMQPSDPTPATPLPAPDPKARDWSYWRKVVKDAYDLHQFPIGFEETQARLDAMARDLDDAHSAAPHGEAVACEGCQDRKTIRVIADGVDIGRQVCPLCAPAARVTAEMVEAFIAAFHDTDKSRMDYRMDVYTALTAALSARTGGTE